MEPMIKLGIWTLTTPLGTLILTVHQGHKAGTDKQKVTIAIRKPRA